MKNRLLIIALTVLAAVSCVQEEQAGNGTQQAKGEVKLTSAATLTIEAAGGSAEITFTASDEWTAAFSNDRASWLSFSPESGAAGQGKVSVTADPNETTDERSAVVRIKCGSATASVTVVQKQKDALTQTPSKTQFGAEGGSFTIEVKSNIDYSFDIDVPWIHQVTTRSMTTKTATFSVDANEDTRKREGSVTVRSALGSEKVTVYQEAAGPSIVLSAESVALKTEGGTFSVDVNTNVDVTMSIAEGAEWLSEVTTRSMSTHTYTFQATANESTDMRTGRITFRNDASGVEASVTVTQMQKDALVVAQDLYEIGAEGGNLSIEASANVDLEVAVSETWVHQVTTRSMTTRSYDFAVDANPGNEVRECTITFSGGAEESPFTQQSPWSLIGSIGGDSWTRDIAMKTDGKWHVVLGVTFTESDEFKFRKDGAWTVNLGANSSSVTTYPGDCLAVLAQDGGNMKLPAGTFDIYLNPDQKRVYFLTAGTPFTYDGYAALAGGLTQTVTIRQDGADGFVANFKDEYKLSAKAQTLELRSRSSVDIAAESNCDWVTVVGTRSMSTRFVTLQIAENTSEKSRTGEVVVSAPSLGLSQTVRIIQSGAGEANIPDPIFRAWMLDRYDTDGDGVLSNEECEAVGYLSLVFSDYPAAYDIESFEGIEYFTNLYNLYINASEMPWKPAGKVTGTINLSSNKNLQRVEIQNLASFEGLDISGNAERLGIVSISYGSSLKKINLPGGDNPRLYSLSISDCPQFGTEMDLSEYHNIQYLFLTSCPALQKVTLPTGLTYTGDIDTHITVAYSGENLFLEPQWADPVLKEVLLAYLDKLASMSGSSFDSNADGKYSIQELRQVTYFELSEESFAGRESDVVTSLEDLGIFQSLIGFNIIGCEGHVRAPLPESIASLKQLANFTIRNTDVYGTIPDSYAGMTALWNMEISNTDISGSLPGFLFTLPEVRYIDLRNNPGLSGALRLGAVPEESKLGFVYLSGCNFDSAVVVAENQQELLRYLDVDAIYIEFEPQVNENSHLYYRSASDGTGPVHADGETVLYHAATKGPGFDIFITGDGFTPDNNAVGGTLETYMTYAAEEIMAQEPYDKLMDWFNIWLVYAHSQREGTVLGSGSTEGLKFSSFQPDPNSSTCMGNLDAISAFVKSGTGRNEPTGTVAVIMNSHHYGGMTMIPQTSLYAPGLATAFVPSAFGFARTFVHEVLGHGFAKLCDEYSTGDNVHGDSTLWRLYGMDSNVDNVSDPARVRWHDFLSDYRYAGEGLGVYEGANTVATGWYRPSPNSVMRHQMEEGGERFNAPSREAIWQRVQVLAHPEQNWSSWEDYVTNGYNREEFVSFDLSPAPAAVKPRRLSSPKRVMRRYVLPDGTVVERKLPPLHPPVIMER